MKRRRKREAAAGAGAVNCPQGQQLLKESKGRDKAGEVRHHQIRRRRRRRRSAAHIKEKTHAHLGKSETA